MLAMDMDVNLDKDRALRLKQSKLRSYRNGYLKAVARKDTAAAEKWKAGYKSLCEEIGRLRQN